jgi:hypothetical protein
MKEVMEASAYLLSAERSNIENTNLALLEVAVLERIGSS